MDSSALIAAARARIGTKFRHQGRNKYGIDCAGLVVASFADIGIKIIDRKAYPRTPFNGELEGQAFKTFVEVFNNQPGDIFLMSFAGHPVSHAAIFTGSTIIHSYQPAGGVVEQTWRDGRPGYRVKTMRYKQWHKQ